MELHLPRINDKLRNAAAATKLAHLGRKSAELFGFVNTPPFRGSTILFENVEELKNRVRARYRYGLTNTPTIEDLASMIAALEDAAGAVLAPSGLSAVTAPLLLTLRPGDQLLVADTVYDPTRDFCDSFLAPRLNIDVIYFDPMIGADIQSLFKPDLRAVFVEAPGSNTFEVPDLPAILEVSKQAGAITMIDNTWATPLIYQPIPNGFD